MGNPNDILKARERRSEIQKVLVGDYNNPLLIIRVNYPGMRKNNEITRYVSETLFNFIKKKIVPLHIKKVDSFEGVIYLIVVKEESPIKLKKVALWVEENHPLGRIVDIDVLDTKGKILSRRELNLPFRRCFICDDYAHVCVRSQKHKLDDVIKFIHSKVHDYKSIVIDKENN